MAQDGVVAVTTQTAEQSLDIDADWLVTDIPPGDVLLQRIGRLHRHKRARPMEFEEPRVTVLAPTLEQLAGTLNLRGGVPKFLDGGLGDQGMLHSKPRPHQQVPASSERPRRWSHRPAHSLS